MRVPMLIDHSGAMSKRVVHRRAPLGMCAGRLRLPPTHRTSPPTDGQPKEDISTWHYPRIFLSGVDNFIEPSRCFSR